jgi:hypothetical protein
MRRRSKFPCRRIGITLLLLAGCAPVQQDSADVIARTTVLQGDASVHPEIEGNVAKYNVRMPFVLRLRNKTSNVTPIAVQICASLDRTIFAQIRRDLSTPQVPCFKPGTAVAPANLGDDPRGMQLFLSSGNAHNYYSARRRIDQRDHVDVFVAGIRGRSGEIVSSGTVYAIVFIDDNQNRVIDQSEYDLLELVVAR